MLTPNGALSCPGSENHYPTFCADMPKRAREDEAKRDALPSAPRSRPPSRIAAPLLSAVAQRRLHEQQQQEQTTPVAEVDKGSKAFAEKRAKIEAKLRARATAVRSLGRGSPSQQPPPELDPPSPAPSSAAPSPSKTGQKDTTDNEDVEMQSTVGTDEDDEATDSRFDALVCSPVEFLTLMATTTGPN